MAFSYSPSLSSSRDWVRMLISDTKSTGAHFQDEELDGLLTRRSTLTTHQLYYTVAADALDILVTRFQSAGRGLEKKQMGDGDVELWFTPKDIGNLAAQAKQYRETAAEIGGTVPLFQAVPLY